MPRPDGERKPWKSFAPLKQKKEDFPTNKAPEKINAV